MTRRAANSDHATLVPAQIPVTLERIERAIKTVAEVMLKHKRRGLKDTILRLEAERDRLRNETDPLEYAKKILEAA